MADKFHPLPDFACSLPLPSGWEERTHNGRSYFANLVSRTTTYKDPRLNSLPKGWELKWDSQRNQGYFYEHSSNTSTTNDPRGLITQPSSTPSSNIPSYAASPTVPAYAASNTSSTSSLPSYVRSNSSTTTSEYKPSYASVTVTNTTNSVPSYARVPPASVNKTPQTKPISRTNTPPTKSVSRNTPTTVRNQAQASPQPDVRIIINGKICSQNEIQILRRAGSPCKPGNYWYDSMSGAMGTSGGPAFCYFVPGLNIGGPLQPNASNGTSGVFVNGRNLSTVDVMNWYKFIGPVSIINMIGISIF